MSGSSSTIKTAASLGIVGIRSRLAGRLQRADAMARRPAKNHDLHGNVPDTARVALVLIDVINDFEFEGGDRLFEHALPMARRILALKRRAKAAGVPTIYANDNFGRWTTDFSSLVRRCTTTRVRGRPIARLLVPAAHDYFVLKPKHSAFFATPLDTLLAYLGTDTLILAGVTGDMCVLLTAAGAFLRDLHVIVPSDCIASIDPAENERALAYMTRVFDADVRPSSMLDLRRMQRPRAA
jgi:nicotinamidase-related amidase